LKFHGIAILLRSQFFDRPGPPTEIRSRFKCILCCDRISSAHPSVVFAAVDTFCRAREQKLQRRKILAIKAAKLRGGAREQIANHAPPPHEKQETSSTLSTASKVSQQLTSADKSPKMTSSQTNVAARVRRALPCVCGQNRYNIDNRPGMRQAPWRDRYVTRVLARPLQPRAPQLFSSRYCCAMSPATQ
jgi:hypothetical protein